MRGHEKQIPITNRSQLAMHSNLKSCIYCGHEMSLSASCCPNCQKTEPPKPRLDTCSFCEREYPPQDGYTHEFTMRGNCDRTSEHHFCPACIKLYYEPPTGTHCPDCNKPLPTMTGNDFIRGKCICPHCGCTKLFAGPICENCKKPIYSFQNSRRLPEFAGMRPLGHEFCRNPPPWLQRIHEEQRSATMVKLIIAIGVVLLLIILLRGC
jgi:hypothetical protein